MGLSQVPRLSSTTRLSAARPPQPQHTPPSDLQSVLLIKHSSISTGPFLGPTAIAQSPFEPHCVGDNRAVRLSTYTGTLLPHPRFSPSR